LRNAFPGLVIAGMESPPFRALTLEEDAAAVARINDSGACIVSCVYLSSVSAPRRVKRFGGCSMAQNPAQVPKLHAVQQQAPVICPQPRIRRMLA